MTLPLDGFKAVHAIVQEALTEFLLADLDLAFTMLSTAQIGGREESKLCEALAPKVRDALATVRQLAVGVENPLDRKRIHDKADELEMDLKGF